ncbi:hypothetical protein OG339_06820 [Streptosporangium sp. NBC_01495]|uniref:hypothetical protein n=1 Tax=Streptosporangium sp. NBC_01495 TaxID=2903899 RepID=UPI002E337F89|nr:hypothetical protein [Streptosporangium sp. NBC_01495]
MSCVRKQKFATALTCPGGGPDAAEVLRGEHLGQLPLAAVALGPDLGLRHLAGVLPGEPARGLGTEHADEVALARPGRPGRELLGVIAPRTEQVTPDELLERAAHLEGRGLLEGLRHVQIMRRLLLPGRGCAPAHQIKSLLFVA